MARALLGLSVLLVIVADAKAGVTAKEFIDHLDSATAQLARFDVVLTISMEVNAAQLDSKQREEYQYRQAVQMDGWKQRHEKLAKLATGELKSTIVCDGETVRAFNAESKTGMIRIPAPYVLDEGHDYLSFYRSARAFYDLPTLLRKRLMPSAKVEQVGSLIVLRTPPIEEKGLFNQRGYEVAVDPAKGFMPVKVDESIRTKDGKTYIYRSTMINRFRELKDGFHVPVEAKVQFFYPAGPNTGKEFYLLTVTVDEKRSHWNEPIKAETFTLGFPVGTEVHDFIRKVRFISGTADPSSNVDDLVAQARETLPMESPKRFKTAYVAHWWEDWRWLSGLAVLVVLAFLSLRYLRSRSMR